MFNKIALITSLLFLLLGTNVFADSQLTISSPQNVRVKSAAAQNISLSPVHNKKISTNKKTGTQYEQDTLAPKQVKPAKPSLKNYVVPGLVSLFIIIGFGGYWFIYRKKHTTNQTNSEITP
ncbi:hypothetical protein KW850_13785 [Bacillus sp. sid0103]|uniref:hypothetical protein n=1 Tax=Bacillus sp. sid0103 TaxID=2856337 RepID=UPI001C460EE2|nr:hypothetical protein [Bacillus sp. sid0103]MBV7506330.1 hypothetical protein [Bacillus sp. sid0103]